MAFNLTGSQEVPLGSWNGLVTDIDPVALPEGCSPDNQDLVYRPGSVRSRPALKRIFATRLGNVSLTYAKTYVDPAGTPHNLYFDSKGNLYVENVVTSPNTTTLLTTLATGSYAKSATAFGREYIAPNDGLHGTDIPLQWDGTNLDRVTQDGPGAPPVAISLALPSVAMLAAAAPVSLTVTTTAGTLHISPTLWFNLTVNVASGALGLPPGYLVTIAGNGNALSNGPFTVLYVVNDMQFVVSASNTTDPAGAGGTCAFGGAATLSRVANSVLANTAAPHNLQVGYQAQITGVAAQTVSAIDQIKIANTDLPGIATIKSHVDHGLVPGNYVSLSGITAVVVGTTITTIERKGQVVTVTMSAPHGLSPGSLVTLAGVTDTTFNSTFQVVSVTSTTVFVFFQNDVDSDSADGTVSLNWPVPDSPDTLYQVIAAPTTTTFQIALNYSDGTWTTGTIKFLWDGTFFVTSIPSTTSFTYQQYGPDQATTVVGAVTPFGQAAPGQHSMSVIFLTRQGDYTKPSPPVQFVANGGQYINVSNIPIGPSNVVARILAFTGALGSVFYYLPAPAQVNGQIVGSATQINDNTTTSITLDFSDNSLFRGINISIPGNNLLNQRVLDGALGFAYFNQRLITYGQRNTLQFLLNMGFDGGVFAGASTIPLGWTISSTPGGIVNGHFGKGFLFSGAGSISQSFYQDAYQQAPIAQSSTKYRFRAWISGGAGLSAAATISAASTGFSTTATITAAAAGAFVEAVFSLPLPAVIPHDITLSIIGSIGLLIDEMSIFYDETPYLDSLLFGSYLKSPGAFDNVTGAFGPATDTRKVMAPMVLRQALYLLTQDPAGRLHGVIDNGTTEPAGWSVAQIAANCGLLSAFALTQSQADDSSASGGEEWAAWMSQSGARIFGGGQPWRISQEIQPDWFAMNSDAFLTCWAMNDYKNRIIYFGLPVGASTAPSLIYPLDYRDLDSAEQIAAASPERAAGKNTPIRKWTRWNLTINGASLLYRSESDSKLVFLSGTGDAPSPGGWGYGNAYTLDPTMTVDDNYGLISPYYVTYPFMDDKLSQFLKVGAHQRMLAYFTATIEGLGTLTITAYKNKLTKPWGLKCIRVLSADAANDVQWPGAQVTAQRIFFKIASTPIDAAIDKSNWFSLVRIVPSLKGNVRMPVR